MRSFPLSLLALALGLAACSDEVPPPSTLYGSYHAPAPTPLSCVPNLDGTIDAAHLQAALGVPSYFLATPSGTLTPVDLRPQVNAQGQNVWAFQAKQPTDQLAMLEASTLEGKWYASSFPQGTFVIPVDLADTQEGIYSEDGSAIWLYGFASSQQSPANGTTLLVYDQPVPTYQFPLQVGASWSGTGTVNDGLLDGLPWNRVDSYTFTVDAAGVLELPELTFTQALRLRTVATIDNVVGGTIVTRSTQFLAQCFGQVYLASSQPGETSDDFSSASEVRRLSLEQ